jgi:hypothetical protein
MCVSISLSEIWLYVFKSSRICGGRLSNVARYHATVLSRLPTLGLVAAAGVVLGLLVMVEVGTYAAGNCSRRQLKTKESFYEAL